MKDPRDIALALVPVGNAVADLAEALQEFLQTLPAEILNGPDLATFVDRAKSNMVAIESAVTLAGRMLGAKV